MLDSEDIGRSKSSIDPLQLYAQELLQLFYCVRFFPSFSLEEDLRLVSAFLQMSLGVSSDLLNRVTAIALLSHSLICL